MKALTIYQPYATMLAREAKRYETRSWSTDYRGPMAFHAAKKVEEGMNEEALAFVQLVLRIDDPAELPTGCIVGIGELVACHLIDEAFVETLSDGEQLVGDFTPGRYAWQFSNVRALEEPIPATGGQRIWNWEEGDALLPGLPEDDGDPDAADLEDDAPGDTSEDPGDDGRAGDPGLLLSLDCETFAKLKKDFDAVLNDTISNMEDKEASDAEITVKLKISISESTTRDREVVAYEATRGILVPEFEHKISSVMAIKDSRSGRLDGEYELAYDRKIGRYVLRKIDHGQTSLYDPKPEEPEMTTTVDGSGNVVDVQFGGPLADGGENPQQGDDVEQAGDDANPDELLDPPADGPSGEQDETAPAGEEDADGQ